MNKDEDSPYGHSELESLDESCSAVDGLDVLDKSSIGDLTVADAKLAVRPFSTLGNNDQPLIPLPIDTHADIQYPTRLEPRCQLCRSPLRERGEHIYLDQGRKPQSVVNFFLKFFNAKISWECVDQHMQHHCSFKHISQSGLKNYAIREEDVMHWKYREIELTETALLVELDDIRGMDCGGNCELKLKRANMVERLTTRLMSLKKDRDDSGTHSVDIFQVLKDIHDAMPTQDSKQVVRDKVRELRERLADG